MTDAAGHPRGIRRRLGTTRRSAFPGDDWTEPSRAEKDLQNAREREDT